MSILFLNYFTETYFYTKKVSKWKIFNLRIFVDFDLHKDLKDPIRCAIYNLAMEKLLCRLGLLGTLWVVRWSCNLFLHQNRRPGFLPLERVILLHGQLFQEPRQIRSRGFARRIYEIKTTTPLEINCLFFVNYVWHLSPWYLPIYLPSCQGSNDKETWKYQ